METIRMTIRVPVELNNRLDMEMTSGKSKNSLILDQCKRLISRGEIGNRNKKKHSK